VCVTKHYLFGLVTILEFLSLQKKYSYTVSRVQQPLTLRPNLLIKKFRELCFGKKIKGLKTKKYL